MTTIGLFNPHNHSYFLYYMSRMATQSGYDVTLYVTQRVHDRMEPMFTDEEYERCEWDMKREEESLDGYFTRVERSAEQEVDLLWMLFAWGHGRVPPNFLEFDPDCPSICSLTNLNDWTYTPFPDSVYDAVDRYVPVLRRLLRTNRANPLFDQLRYLMQPGVVDNYDAVHIEYPPMARFVENEVDWDQEIYEFYPVIYEADKLPSVERTDARRIAVPGRISQHIRNVDLLLDAMEAVFDRTDREVILDFIGRNGGYDAGVDRIEALQERGFDVRYRESWIPREEFAASMYAADLVVNPLHVRRILKHPLRSDMWTGRTNGTGITFDVLRYARPLVVPELYPVDDRIQPFTEKFDDVDHLTELLLELIENDERLQSLRTAAESAAADVTVEAQGRRFRAVVEDILA